MSSGMTHWGTVVTDALKARGIDTIFTLSGGHIFPIYDGAVGADIKLIDVRHEATAAFAAEAWARLTRGVGVAAVTAGPGVFNAVNGLASAQKNGAALLLLGGRAPETRWGMGSLQEIDHVPVMAPLSKIAMTASDQALRELTSAMREAMSPPRGPAFFDFSLDLIASSEGVEADTAEPTRHVPDPDAISKIAGLMQKAERPMLIAGSNVYADSAWEAMKAFVESAEVPTFTNGMGRGTLPADHRLAFSRARSKAMKETDLAIVAGTPFDFRLSFGDKFPKDASVIHLDSSPDLITNNRGLTASIGADLELTFQALADASIGSSSKDWLLALRQEEEKLTDGVAPDLASDRTPVHPMRIYGELIKMLDRDTVVVGDGGDFVSYAGREVPSYTPGSWLDPGPFGCLGTGPGYAIASKLLYPDRQVVLLLGDGAFGFSGMEFDTMVRHNLPVVGIVGNNGIWALEKHPMQAFFGYDVAADLNQGTRYDKIVEAVGGYGEMVTDPDEIGPALKRAFDSGVPSLLNILTDPNEIYPRSANLA
ncbi:MAG TPA: acetolactate synthase [Actinomycetota bacterium]|nr:acetolactate synthase [Actinomycetota bacterium]